MTARVAGGRRIESPAGLVAHVNATRTANPYRTGGVTVPMAALREHLAEDANELVIDLG
jgi:hypothetical protein